MKKVLLIVLFLAIVFSSIPAATVFANDEVSVTINGHAVVFEGQGPAIVDGRTLVPVRGVFETVGFEVTWDNATRTATLSNDDYEVRITVGNNTFTTNGVNHTLDVPAQIIGGRTMVPIRLPLESVGIEMGWDGATQTVRIATTGSPALAADGSIRVVVNNHPGFTAGEEVSFPEGRVPILVDGEVYLPMQGFDPLLLGWAWFDGEAVNIRGPRRIILLTPDSLTATIEGSNVAFDAVEHQLEFPARRFNSTMHIPLREVLEILGHTMKWDATTRTVVIDTNFNDVIAALADGFDENVDIGQVTYTISQTEYVHHAPGWTTWRWHFIELSEPIDYSRFWNNVYKVDFFNSEPGDVFLAADSSGIYVVLVDTGIAFDDDGNAISRQYANISWGMSIELNPQETIIVD